MFEIEPDKNSEQSSPSSSHIFVLALGAGALITLALIFFLYTQSRREERPVLERVVRAGTPEFDNYKDKIVFDVRPEDKVTHPNMIGMFQLEIRARMTNRGDRTLSGVEVLAKMLDLSGKVIAVNTGIPIPRIRPQPLRPGETVSISLKVDAPGRITEGEVKDITIELRGLQFD
ncbi:MAG: YwbE family protein [Acidobacteria bacterium]|nr:YwbE family protein [Acidobacteriota bacterium]